MHHDAMQQRRLAWKSEQIKTMYKEFAAKLQKLIPPARQAAFHNSLAHALEK